MRFKKILVVFGVAAALAAAHLISTGGYDRPTEFKRASDLDRQDCRIGVLAGYDSENVSRRVFPRASIVGFHEFDDAFTALLAGRIEAFVYNEHVLNVGLRAYPNRFRILDDVLSREPAVVLVAEKHRELLPKINQFIRGLRLSGYYDDMFTRWCQSDEYVPMPEVPELSAANGVLRIGTSGTEEPSSFIDDNDNLVGFDIEFARRLAQALRLKPEIVCRPDDEILSELASGALDLVIDDYNVNEVTDGMLHSDGYFDSDMKVMVRRSGDSGVMLGSKRLGYTSRFIKDPRIALFVRGFFTTLALTVLSAMLGFVFAFVLRQIDRRSPRFVQSAIAGILEVVRLLPPPVVILMFSSAILVTADAWYIAVWAFSFWFAAFLEPVASTHPRQWLPVVRAKLIELMQWTSVVGSINVCDLTMAADLVCGRSLAAFGPLLSVAAAYCLMNWIVARITEFLERKLG